MTIEQCKQSTLDKQSQVTQLQQEIADRKEQLIELSPIKVGGKVLLTNGAANRVGFIKRIELSHNLSYYYVVNEPNKTGKKASNSRLYFDNYNTTITKI